MVYSFALTKHANIRYRESLHRLAGCELEAMLRRLGRTCEARAENLGGAVFLTFSCAPLTEAELLYLAGHSTLALMTERREDGLLRPLESPETGYLPEDLPEILKYKGKTSVSFTRLMINIALSLTDFEPGGATVLDPLCGKGTTLFCALQAGMNAVGMDADKKALKEAADFFRRYLQYHGLKHRMNEKAETLGKQSIPVTEFLTADTKEHYDQGDTRTLRLACGDTSLIPALTRKRRPHLVIADLPYGIQHAPTAGARPEPFRNLIRRAFPVWQSAMVPGGAAAFSFNTLTLTRADVVSAAEAAGLRVIQDEIFQHLRHEVEQAVVRDVVFAVKDKEELHS